MENRAESPTLDELQQQNNKLEQQIAELAAKLKWYEEQFRLAQQKRFGASSEKTNLDQIELNLFNEAEVLATPPGQKPPMEKVTYERRKTTGKREADLEHLPVETVTYQLAEGDQVCACCGGSLHEIRRRAAKSPSYRRRSRSFGTSGRCMPAGAANAKKSKRLS